MNAKIATATMVRCAARVTRAALLAHTRRGPARAVAALVIAAALATISATLFPTTASAQNVLQVRGLVDMVGGTDEDIRWLNTVNTADSNFDPLRARLFIDGRRENTEVFLQFLISDQSRNTFRLFGGYLLHKVREDRDIYIEAGLIPTHDGIWAPNTYSNKNPLISVPLAYFWKTTLPSQQMPNSIDELPANAGQGQTGIVYADSNGVRGEFYATTVMAYDNCWNLGLYSIGSVGQFEYATGVTLGAPSAPLNGPDTNDDIAVHAKLGYAFTHGVKFYLSAARGAYLARAVEPYLPAGRSVNDYKQTLLAASADVKWWQIHFMSEYFINQMETPLTDETLRSDAFYLQAAYTLFPGWELAARYDDLRFGDVTTSTGPQAWDRDVRRVESGLTYRLSRDLRLKGVVQLTDVGAGLDDNILNVVQVSFTF